MIKFKSKTICHLLEPYFTTFALTKEQYKSIERHLLVKQHASFNCGLVAKEKKMDFHYMSCLSCPHFHLFSSHRNALI